MPKNVFIAYDFSIKGNLTLNLEEVHDHPPDGFAVEWPGAPDGRTQGAIWKDVVEPKIGWCDRLLAFADLPNANVGFELGYALARGKEAAIARVREKLPTWLDRPPMNGFLCQRAETLDSIHALLNAKNWVKPPKEVPPGDGVLALCAPGSAVAKRIDPTWNWRRPEKHGWDLHDVPELFKRIGRVVWIISPHDEGIDGRDGSDNSALAILAGYALGRNLTLDVFHHIDARKVVDVAARHAPFSDLGKLHSLLESVAEEHAKSVAAKGEAAPTPEQRAILTAEVARPKDLRPLPDDDWNALQLPRFIGRERELEDAKAAVKAVSAGDASAARIWWVHGFGGMGKSWFLRRLAVDAVQTQPDLGVLLVEWDSETWQEPLAGEPRSPADIYHTIAWRLAQVRGVAVADAYWLARSRVEAAAETHRALERHFDAALIAASQGDRIETVLLDLLKGEGLMDADGRLRTSPFEKWRLDSVRRDRTFETWAEKAASCPLGSDAKAAIAPDHVLRDGLAEALRAASSTAPVLLILDTCEVLTEKPDRALRSLVTSLVRDHARVLFFIGSRLAPDLAQAHGSREGWRAELRRVNLRELPFAENVRFTVEEIEGALTRLKRPAPNVSRLAERLHSLTYGVPFALRSLFDIHENEDQSTILTELADGNDEPLGEEEALRRVTQMVADRMLYHLANRPDREDDLEDIVALALLPRADPTVLALLWPGGVRQRLRELSTRYSLLGGGDLHPTVRRYLRRHWRSDERPPVFARVLEHLEGIADSLPAPGEHEGIAGAIERRLLHVSLASWRQGVDCADALARNLAVALAYEEGVAPLVELLRELTEAAPQPIRARELLPKRAEWDESPFLFMGTEAKLIQWVRRAAGRSENWTAQEEACAILLEGITLTRSDLIERGKALICSFTEAVARFTADSTPRRARVATSLWLVLDHLHNNKNLLDDPETGLVIERGYLTAILLAPHQAALHNNLGNLYAGTLERPQDAERAYLKAIELAPNAAHSHFNLGNLYAGRLERPQDAERELLQAIELDPKFPAPHHRLGHLYEHTLARPQDTERAYLDAERAYLEAIQLAPKDTALHHNLGHLYQHALARPQDAERAYLQAIQLAPKDAALHHSLGHLYQHTLARPQDAEREFLQAIELDPRFAAPHHSLGHLYEHALARPEDAERAYLQAIQLAPKNAALHHSLGHLYQHTLARPQDAEREFLQAIELDPKFAAPHHSLGHLYEHALARPQDAERVYLDAERAYLRAIQLAPKGAALHQGLGHLYEAALARPQDAEREFLRAIELDPKFAAPHYGLGHLYQHALARPQDAEREFLKATELQRRR